jgi:hypothetical protein
VAVEPDLRQQNPNLMRHPRLLRARLRGSPA